mgnify:CR=1 FL=1
MGGWQTGRMARTALFIGGTGVISAACVLQAVGRGWRVSVLNRGQTAIRPLPSGVEVLRGDAHQPSEVAELVGGRHFDVVAQFVAFRPEQVTADIELFAGACDQYMFISSASAYAKPVRFLPITESTPLSNPVWEYSRDKIACEELLGQAFRHAGFPVTIVRPSHTYDRTSIPLIGGWTAVRRLVAGRPVVVPGDGTSLWTLTHARDLATGFVGIMGRRAAIGEAFHITSDECLSWDEITRTVAEIAGVSASIVHVTSQEIAAHDADFGAGLLGDKSHSLVFDNSKIRRLVPDYVCHTSLADGAAEALDWYASHADQVPYDQHVEELFDDLVAAHQV